MDNYDKNLMEYQKTIRANVKPLKALEKYLNENLSNWTTKLWKDNAQLNIFIDGKETNFTIYMNGDKYRITCQVGSSYISSNDYSQRSKAYVKKFIEQFEK